MGNLGRSVTQGQQVPPKAMVKRRRFTREKTRTDFVQRPAAMKTGLETFLKLKKTPDEKFGKRNLVRD